MVGAHDPRPVDGALRVAGHDVRELARDVRHAACWCSTRATSGRGAVAFRAAFADCDVHYAAKAFLTTTLARWVAEEGLGLDVATGGELAVALRAGFPPARIVLHGNNKSLAELEAAVDAGVGRVVLDSFAEIERLARVAAGRDRVVDVLVRVTVGVEAHTHEFIATAHEDQKFGFSLATGEAAEGGRRGPGGAVAAAGRPALPHRVADLRHLRLRGRRPPGGGAGRAAARRARDQPSTSSTWAAVWASRT